ncbi:nitrogen fixation protein FixH [Blastomonas natatoria]|uniref:Nitrogen fixation protein FixH n=1 Tax=Blastomonas natatoria TaxID=34015 RepID=A0A2V3V9J0_9SPHN|nr:FixH family protein [Blastomonas natatoria]PXW73389.1 nitrogen fixation protein FixH [Blastomonas natatoria]
MATRTAPRPFTGWHITAILVGFFVIVMAVNFTMARLALSSFGGKVVENSYVASQHYNELLEKAEAQDRLGWQPSVWLDRTRHVRVTLAHDGERLPIESATAMIHHPLGRLPSQALVMVGDGQGGIVSTKAIPQGRWRIELAVTHGDDEARYRRDLK